MFFFTYPVKKQKKSGYSRIQVEIKSSRFEKVNYSLIKVK